MIDYICDEGQTIFDIALEVYGSLEGIAFLQEDNPEVFEHGFPPNIYNELVMKIRPDSIINNQTYDYLKKYRTTFNIKKQLSIETQEETGNNRLDFFVLDYNKLA